MGQISDDPSPTEALHHFSVARYSFFLFLFTPFLQCIKWFTFLEGPHLDILFFVLYVYKYILYCVKWEWKEIPNFTIIYKNLVYFKVKIVNI